MAVTRRQKEILDFLETFVSRNGYSPSFEEIARGMWENLGRTFAEFFHLDRIFNSGRIEFESREIVESLRGHGRGVACGLHLGNWEILTQSGMLMDWRPAGVYQRLANPFVDRYVNAMRAPYYLGGLMEKSPRTAVALLRYAREGGTVALLADHRESRGIASPFFGRPAPSTSKPYRRWASMCACCARSISRSASSSRA